MSDDTDERLNFTFGRTRYVRVERDGPLRQAPDGDGLVASLKLTEVEEVAVLSVPVPSRCEHGVLMFEECGECGDDEDDRVEHGE